MSLSKAYTIDGTYGYASRLSDQFLHASIVDSTSPFNLAGGLYYTYHSSNPSGGPAGHGHEGGLALSFPFGPYVSIGATLKYFKLEDADVFNGHDGGLTFDVGATIRPTEIVSLGLVGTNLRDLGDQPGHPGGRLRGGADSAHQHAGGGRRAHPLHRRQPDGAQGDLADGRRRLHLLRQARRARRGRLRRVDGQRLPRPSGCRASPEIGAFDGGIRQDLTRSMLASGAEVRETVLQVSLRLFIPASQTQDPSLDMQETRAPVNNP